MSRLLVLPMLLSLCPATATAQDATPAQKNFAVTVNMIARIPGVPEDVLKGLFHQVSYLEATRQTFFSSYGIDGQHQNSALTVTTIVPERQVILSWNYYYLGSKAPVESDAAAAAVAKVFQERLQALLYQPAFEDLTRQIDRAEVVSRNNEELCARSGDRLAELGTDDLTAVQHALTDLQQKLLDVELDRRTEEAMQARLQLQMERSRDSQHESQKRFAALIQLRDAVQKRFEVALVTPEKERGADFAQQLTALQAEVRQLQPQLDDVGATTAHAQSLYSAAAEQLTTSTLALQRHLSRKQVLEELIDRQKQIVAETSRRSRERERVQREADAARAAADAARARVLDLRRQRDALEPVQVTPWK